MEVEAVSSLYETEPVGEILDQPDFLNAAARVSTELEPLELLDACKAHRATARDRSTSTYSSWATSSWTTSG
jgi:2-amino-4-hydroxy-6-hydroxymethyldihydropteridine diphosphokinase